MLSLVAGAVGILVVVLIAFSLRPKRKPPAAKVVAPPVPGEAST
jgi:hypothetical protein